MATATATIDPQGAVAPEAVASFASYQERCSDLAASAGILNATHGHLVAVAVECLAEGDHIGPGLHSFPQFLAWRTGISVTTAKAVQRIARRAGELPVLVAALQAGEISLEQAAVVARNVPAELDESATRLAKVATVTQLKAVLPAYRTKPSQGRPAGSHVSVTEREDGTMRISGELDADQGALVRKALDAMRDDLWRQRKADAKALAAESGQAEEKVAVPTGAEALASIAEAALRAGEAAHPGSDRYLISYHLQATEDGRLVLLDDRGNVVDEAERRRVLCDHRFDHVLHDHPGAPLSVGRASRHIGRKLRRTVLHRHGGRCAVPGCEATHGLEVHHIVHWEDGGTTDTANLLAICRRHHKAHHQGLISIEGDADLPPGTPGAVRIGTASQPLPSSGVPRPVPAAPAGVRPLEHLRAELHERTGVTAPRSSSTPVGERLDRRGMHLQPEPPPDATQPPPDASRSHHRHRRTQSTARRSPDGPPDAHGPPAA